MNKQDLIQSFNKTSSKQDLTRVITLLEKPDTIISEGFTQDFEKLYSLYEFRLSWLIKSNPNKTDMIQIWQNCLDELRQKNCDKLHLISVGLNTEGYILFFDPKDNSFISGLV